MKDNETVITVGDMIERLLKYPKSLPVYIQANDSWTAPVVKKENSVERKCFGGPILIRFNQYN